MPYCSMTPLRSERARSQANINGVHSCATLKLCFSISSSGVPPLIDQLVCQVYYCYKSFTRTQVITISPTKQYNLSKKLFAPLAGAFFCAQQIKKEQRSDDIPHHLEPCSFALTLRA